MPLGGEAGSVRAAVLAAVRAFPGVHLRGLAQHLGASAGLVRYHLQALLDDGEVRAVQVGGFVRYFPVAAWRELSPGERRMLQVLRQERPLEIVLALLEFGTLQHRDLLELVGGAKATLTYHLDKLVAAGVVAKVPRGPARGFSVHDPARVRALLARYEPVPEVLERVHDTWDDLFGGHRAARRRLGRGTRPGDEEP